MITSGLSDALLARLLRDRSAIAYTDVYQAYADKVRTSARLILQDQCQVEDVVQTVFESLWARPERFDPSRSSLATFLSLDGRFRAIDLARAERSRARRELSAVSLQHVELSEFGFDQIHDVTVRRCLARLPKSECRALLLAYERHMTYREVAEYLELPAGTVKSQIRRALARLRVFLEAERSTIDH